eukprot:NODE_440_length_7390_cov_0.787546.p4 type:complete len:261 gc:universal NODE_440_length_7390_cov_0.787546:544-1326(+)
MLFINAIFARIHLPQIVISTSNDLLNAASQYELEALECFKQLFNNAPCHVPTEIRSEMTMKWNAWIDAIRMNPGSKKVIFELLFGVKQYHEPQLLKRNIKKYENALTRILLPHSSKIHKNVMMKLLYAVILDSGLLGNSGYFCFLWNRRVRDEKFIIHADQAIQQLIQDNCYFAFQSNDGALCFDDTQDICQSAPLGDLKLNQCINYYTNEYRKAKKAYQEIIHIEASLVHLSMMGFIQVIAFVFALSALRNALVNNKGQ